jgi:hypothetical protein
VWRGLRRVRVEVEMPIVGLAVAAILIGGETPSLTKSLAVGRSLLHGRACGKRDGGMLSRVMLMMQKWRESALVFAIASVPLLLLAAVEQMLLLEVCESVLWLVLLGDVLPCLWKQSCWSSWKLGRGGPVALAPNETKQLLQLQCSVMLMHLVAEGVIEQAKEEVVVVEAMGRGQGEEGAPLV